MLIDRSYSLSTPVRAAAQPKATSVVEVGTRPIDLILSSGFCAFARQAGNFFCILFTIRKAHSAFLIHQHHLPIMASNPRRLFTR